MGMYDHVKYDGSCPECGAIIRDWQSKDGPCLLNTLDPWQVKQFYSPCPACKAWVTATVDAEVEHVVKRCDISFVKRCDISFKAGPYRTGEEEEQEKPEEGAVPEWLKKVAAESKGKILSLEEMRKILSKCSSLSDEIFRERHGEEEIDPDGEIARMLRRWGNELSYRLRRMRHQEQQMDPQGAIELIKKWSAEPNPEMYCTECPVCGEKIKTEAVSSSEAYKLLTPLRWAHLESAHCDELTKKCPVGFLCIFCRKLIKAEGETKEEQEKSYEKHYKEIHPGLELMEQDGFPVWVETGAQVVFPMLKKSSISKCDNSTEPVAEDDEEEADDFEPEVKQ